MNRIPRPRRRLTSTATVLTGFGVAIWLSGCVAAYQQPAYVDSKDDASARPGPDQSSAQAPAPATDTQRKKKANDDPK